MARDLSWMTLLTAIIDKGGGGSGVDWTGLLWEGGHHPGRLLLVERSFGKLD